MISIFKKYNIIPLFIFDGKPPPEKTNEITRRIREKKEAKRKYMELLQQNTEIKGMEYELNALKKQFVSVSFKEIEQVKQLLTAFNIYYLEASGEADYVCASMVLNGKAWACLSDDMDMLLYDCPRVLRHISLKQHSVLLYNTQSILCDLKMNIHALRIISILSGTDYNTENIKPISLHDSYTWYHCEYLCEYAKTKLSFDDWLVFTGHINHDIDIREISRLFYVNIEDDATRLTNNLLTKLKPQIDNTALASLLEKDGFIFI